jgi:2-polyprenyl-6-methoxyphenol hydroxylase-like FAD-dependent oxidoreductase
LALFLEKAGISCALYEAHPFVEGVGGGLALAPNGMKVLAALGLADHLRERATTISTYAFRNDRGALLARARINPSVNRQPMVAMSRALLFETLAAAMRERHVDVRYRKRLDHIEEHPSRVIGISRTAPPRRARYSSVPMGLGRQFADIYCQTPAPSTQVLSVLVASRLLRLSLGCREIR